MKELYDLKHKRAGLIDQAQEALKLKNMDEYSRLMGEITTLNGEIEAYENLAAEQGRFSDSNPQMLGLSQIIENKKEAEAFENKLDAARRGNEYANAWAYAMQNGVSLKNGRGVEQLKPLYNALTITGGTPVGSDGGFLVPVDFDNKLIRKLKEFVRLADFFKVEEVTTYSGWRAIETAASRTPLPQIQEAQTIAKKDKPKFLRIDYTIKDYGDRIPISNDLLEDNSVGLMDYLVEWFTPRVVLTENSLLLALLDALTATALAAGKEIAQLKSALNKGLNTAISRSAAILVNQSSYDFLDQQVDSNGRPMLVPLPTEPDVYRFKNRPVTVADDDLLPNRVTEGASPTEYMPLYIGHFKAFGTLFRRKALEFATTNVGGEAWSTNTTEVRGIARMDAQKADESAAIKREIKVS